MKQKNPSLWALVGKVSAILLIVLTAIQIYQFFNEPRPDLTVYGYINEIDLPSHLIDAIHSSRNSVLRKLSNQNKEMNSEELIKELLNESGKRNIEELMKTFSAWEVPNTFVHLIITNDGDRVAENLTLDSPGRGWIQILFPDKENIESSFYKSQNIGNVRPKDKVFIRLWLNEELTAYDKKKIKITFSQGAVYIDSETWDAKIVFFFKILATLIGGGFLLLGLIIYLVFGDKKLKIMIQDDEDESKAA